MLIKNVRVLQEHIQCTEHKKSVQTDISMDTKINMSHEYLEPARLSLWIEDILHLCVVVLLELVLI